MEKNKNMRRKKMTLQEYLKRFGKGESLATLNQEFEDSLSEAEKRKLESGCDIFDEEEEEEEETDDGIEES